MGARRSAGQYQSDSELPFLTQSLLSIGNVPVGIGRRRRLASCPSTLPAAQRKSPGGLPGRSSHARNYRMRMLIGSVRSYHSKRATHKFKKDHCRQWDAVLVLVGTQFGQRTLTH